MNTRARIWDTCDYALGAFSPDGRYLIGTAAYGDSIGSPVLAVLDAADGHLVVEFEVDTRAGSTIGKAVWDTDGSVLGMVYDEGWALMRLGVDGSFANVSTGRIAGEPESQPVFFGARP